MMLCLRTTAVVGNSALLLSDVIDFVILPSHILAGNSFIIRSHVTLK